MEPSQDHVQWWAFGILLTKSQSVSQAHCFIHLQWWKITSALLYFHIIYLINLSLSGSYLEHNTFQLVSHIWMRTYWERWCTAECTCLSQGLLHWRIPLLPSSCSKHRLVWSQDLGENILPGRPPHEPTLAAQTYRHAGELHILPVW